MGSSSREGLPCPTRDADRRSGCERRDSHWSAIAPVIDHNVPLGMYGGWCRIKHAATQSSGSEDQRSDREELPKGVEMGFFFRKSKSRGPFRLNLSKKGLGLSFGIKGARIGIGPRGVTTSVGKGGLYWRKLWNPFKASHTAEPPPGGQALPVASTVPHSRPSLSRIVLPVISVLIGLL